MAKWKFTSTCSCYKRMCKACKCKEIGCIPMCFCEKKYGSKQEIYIIGILQISFAHDNNVYFLTMVHKNQFTPISTNYASFNWGITV